MVKREIGMIEDEPLLDITSDELAIIERRELAVQATGFVSEILERDVTVGGLMAVAEQEVFSQERLIARRALRCITSVAEEDSAILEAVGEDGVYDYAEGVINFGAANFKYLELIKNHGLSGAEATGMYALREQIANHTGGGKPSFRMIREAAGRVSLTVGEAARDPEAAAAAFDDAGFLTDHNGNVQYNRTIFSPGLSKVIEDPNLDEIAIARNKPRTIIDGFPEDLNFIPEEIED